VQRGKEYIFAVVDDENLAVDYESAAEMVWP